MTRFKDRDVVLVRVANDRRAFKVANNTNDHLLEKEVVANYQWSRFGLVPR